MKELLIVRHAKSSWEDISLDDFDRPLNERGKRDALVMAERAIRHQFIPDFIMCSSAKRTRKTLNVFLKAFGIKKDKVLYTGELYLAEPRTIVEVIHQIPDHCERAMLIGHNPGLTDFINEFSNIRIDNLPTCGICCVRFFTESWSEIERRSGDVLYLEYPKLFSA